MSIHAYACLRERSCACAHGCVIVHVQDFWKTYVTPGVLTLVALTIAFITAGSVCTCKLCNLFCFEFKLWYQPRQLRKPFWRVNFGSISAGHMREGVRARAHRSCIVSRSMTLLQAL